jgi:hypothetical protein
VEERKNQNCGPDDQVSHKKVMEKGKAPVLWTIQCEEVDENEQEHRGMIRNTKATHHNKWQQKRLRNDEVMTPNVNQRFEDGTQGLKTKSINLPSMFENK